MINYILYFFIYAFAGWLCETMIYSIKHRKFVNRGLLFGPMMVLYGLIPVLGVFFLEPNKNDFVFTAFSLCVVSGVTETILCLASDKILHARLWDYSNHRWHILGYTCFSSIVIKGIASAVVVKWIHPQIARALNAVHFHIRVAVVIILLVLIVFDFLFTVIGVHGIIRESKQMQSMSEQISHLKKQVSRAIASFYNLNKTKRSVRRLQKHLEKNQAKITKQENSSDKTTRFGAGKSFYKLFWIFVIGSVIGCFTEIVFMYITTGVLMNRSSLIYGPFSVVWGLGAVVLTMVLYGWNQKSDRYIFLGGLFIGGVYEYACSVFTEFFFGSVFWDYSGIPFNINGRINLLYCGFWGLLALLWVKGIYPHLSCLIEKIPVRPGKIISILLALFLSADMLLSAAVLARMEERAAGKKAEGAIDVFLDKTYDDQFISKQYQNLKPVFKNIK
ncbi:MAG: putative ABC transporter permease [Clostridiales bacterium]|nr:putative ABC transporter permease [Clostridiales bacterium]